MVLRLGVIIRRVLALLIATGLLLGACGGDAEAPARATIEALAEWDPFAEGSGIGPGDPAPQFIATRLDGSLVSPADLQGRPVIINFWLTTCEPCIREMPLLARAVTDHATDGLIVLAVNPEESKAVIDSFLDTIDLDDGIDVVLDPDAVITHAYLAPAYPTTYFIDRDGVIRYRRF